VHSVCISTLSILKRCACSLFIRWREFVFTLSYHYCKIDGLKYGKQLLGIDMQQLGAPGRFHTLTLKELRLTLQSEICIEYESPTSCGMLLLSK
jgi:hypothetical protein